MIATAAMRSEAEVARLLERVEQEHDVYRHVVDGVAVWRILRFEIGLRLQNLGLSRKPIPKSEILRSFVRAVRQMARPAAGLRYLGKTSNSGLRAKNERGFLDVYFDDLIDHLEGGAKMSAVDAAGFSVNARQAARDEVFDDTPVFVVSALLGRAFPVKGHDETFRQLSEVITSDLGLADFDPGAIRRRYSVLRWREWLYRHALMRLKPRSVLVPNSGQFALFLAARSLRIPFVEMQHGVFSADHPDCLPQFVLGGAPDPLLLPDYFAAYGDYWTDHLNATALGVLGRLRSVGAPLIDSARAVRRQKFSGDNSRPVLVMTLQGGSGSRLLARFASDLLASHDGDMSVTLKLHPGYDADVEVYRSILPTDRRLSVIPGNAEIDTYTLIAMADLHLSISSACHYDAIGIGTPTAVLALPGHELVLDLVTRGDAILVESPQSLATMVGRRSWGRIARDASDRYFREDYVANMRRLLDEIDRAELGIRV